MNRRFTSLTVVALAIPFALSAGSIAAGPVALGDDAVPTTWTYLDTSQMPFTMQDSKVITLQGAVDESSRCQATLTLDHVAGSPPVTAVELAYDLSTCRQLIEIGTASAIESASTSSDAKRLATASIARAGIEPLSLHRTQGYFYTYWHDPLWLVVNSVQDEMIWDYNPPYIWDIVAAWDDIDWFTPTGWYVTSHPAPVETLDYNDAWATLASHASFYNTAFCGGTGTSYSQTN